MSAAKPGSLCPVLCSPRSRTLHVQPPVGTCQAASSFQGDSHPFVLLGHHHKKPQTGRNGPVSKGSTAGSAELGLLELLRVNSSTHHCHQPPLGPPGSPEAGKWRVPVSWISSIPWIWGKFWLILRSLRLSRPCL